MLFHNRPAKAAMGSVIVNGGVQLRGDLKFGATGSGLTKLASLPWAG